MEIDNKVAIVTGAANGIGRTIAKYLYNEGAFVYIADIDTVNGSKVSDALGDRSFFVPCDITNDEDRKGLIDKIIDKQSTVDILINNAGTAIQAERDYREKYRGDFKMYGMEIYFPTLELNFCAPVAMMQLVIPYMEKNEEGGSIIAISSVNTSSLFELPAYTSAKAALEANTKLFAVEYAKFGVKINIICPGPIETEDTLDLYKKDPKQEEIIKSVIPSRKIGATDDVAKAVISTIQNDSMIGSIITVDGGFSLYTPAFKKSEE